MSEPFDIEAEIARMLELETDDGALVLWHRTPSAATILADGFRDVSGLNVLIEGLDDMRGVYVSNRPLDRNEGAKGRDLLRIALRASEQEIDAFEIKSEEQSFREWLLPAELLNSRCSAAHWDDAKEKEISA